jgi:hypothetical protein
MTETELDELYAELCSCMTALGEKQSQLYLARLVLLLMHEVDDPARIREAICAAREIDGNS